MFKWIRWLLFNWLAVTFAFLAGRRFASPNKPIETQSQESRISFLMFKSELSEDEEEELVELVSQFEEEILIIDQPR